MSEHVPKCPKCRTFEGEAATFIILLPGRAGCGRCGDVAPARDVENVERAGGEAAGPN
jgi:hypothetical protein